MPAKYINLISTAKIPAFLDFPRDIQQMIIESSPKSIKLCLLALISKQSKA